MTQFGGFDPTFDFRTEAGIGEDPDSTSPTLRAYHRLLWSKPLPSGDPFDLDDTKPGAYLHHLSARGEFYLTSDSASPTFIRYQRMADIIRLIPESEREQFLTVAHRIGGKMVFPVGKVDCKQTINQERGRNSQIADRLDLTLECIRLHYLGETSPLAEALVSDDSSAVKFLMPFADFGTSPLPDSVEAYQDYRRNAIRFVEARNRRMAEYVARL
jgi:uncharacterized protein DUF6994